MVVFKKISFGRSKFNVFFGMELKRYSRFGINGKLFIFGFLGKIKGLMKLIGFSGKNRRILSDVLFG